MNLVNWWGSLKIKFAFGDHSFTPLAAARWQDSMSCGQKSWIFFNFPRYSFVHIWTMWRQLWIKSVSGKKNRGHRTSKIVKSRQSYSSGHLPYHCSFCYLARALMHDVACEFACAIRMGRNNNANVLKCNTSAKSVTPEQITHPISGLWLAERQ